MNYLDYETIKRRYERSCMQVVEILEEQDQLFLQTQPHGISYGDKVKTTSHTNPIESYIIAREQRHIDERLREAKAISKEWENLLDEKEQELRKSKDIVDIIYCLRFIDRQRVRRIHQRVHYSESQIYRILEKIRRNIDELFEI